MPSRLIGKLFLAAMPIALLVGTTNAVVDPGRVIRADAHAARMALILVAGRAIEQPGNYDERLLQRAYVRGLQQPPEVIVLGSSRSMGVGQELFPSRRFFNHSVSGATIEDYLAVYGMYLRRGWRPSLVVLGIDPWVLNRQHQQLRWASYAEEYEKTARRWGLPVRPGTRAQSSVWTLRRLSALLSPSYFQTSLATLRDRHAASRGAPSIKRADGVLEDAQNLSRSTPEEVRERVAAMLARRPIDWLGSFTALDPAACQALEALIEDLHAHGADALVLLSPYHPDVYDQLATLPEYRMVLEAERSIKELARRHHVRVIGSYDPRACHCVATDFSDGMHMTIRAVQRLFQSSAAGARADANRSMASAPLVADHDREGRSAASGAAAAPLTTSPTDSLPSAGARPPRL